MTTIYIINSLISLVDEICGGKPMKKVHAPIVSVNSSPPLPSNSKVCLFLGCFSHFLFPQKQFPKNPAHCFLLPPLHQDANAWSLLGHTHFLMGDFPSAKDCYERTVDYVTRPIHLHAVYLRLADIYLREQQVAMCVVNTTER